MAFLDFLYGRLKDGEILQQRDDADDDDHDLHDLADTGFDRQALNQPENKDDHQEGDQNADEN